MKTLVLQSFRVSNVPDWLALCLASVQRWAALKGYEYRFADDSFFDILPDWFRARTGLVKTLWADYARVLWAQRFLQQGYERFVWVDADVLVFAPEALVVDGIDSYGFCHEVWLSQPGAGQALGLDHRINNAVSVYVRGNPFLDFYADAMTRILHGNQPLRHDTLGTSFLDSLAQALPLPVLFNVGMFCPLVMQAIAENDAALLGSYTAALHAPLAAGNVCNSLCGRQMDGVLLTDALYLKVIEACGDSGGEVINRHRHSAASPHSQTSPMA